MAATEAVVTEWTTRLSKADVAAAAKRYKVPCAPVRNPVEVMNDPHMHERGMLPGIVHPSLGEIVVPDSPLRLHGAERVTAVPSPGLGQHNNAVYGDWLGLGAAEIETLQRDGVI